MQSRVIIMRPNLCCAVVLCHSARMPETPFETGMNDLPLREAFGEGAADVPLDLPLNLPSGNDVMPDLPLNDTEPQPPR